MKTAKTYEAPTWLMWRCDHGRQWTSAEGGVFADRELDGRECDFSGCAAGHVARIVGQTVNREIASDWSHVGKRGTP